MIDPLDPVQLGGSISETLQRGGHKLTEMQSIMLVGSLSVWIPEIAHAGVKDERERAHMIFRSSVESLRELREAGYTLEYLEQRINGN